MNTIKLRRNKFLFYAIPLVLVACLIGTVAIADDVKIQAVSNLLSKRYPLDNYRSYLSTERGLFGLMNGDKIVEAINGLAEIFFTLTRLVYLVFDFFVEQFYSMDVIGRLSDIIALLTNNLWDMFKSNYATLIIVIAILWVGKTYFMESPREALYQLGKIILVLVISGIWFPRANHYLTQMNNYSFGFQAEIMKVSGSVDATSALTQAGGTNTDQATNIMRNELFKQTIYQPFLLVNYGTVNADEINKLYEKVDDKKIPKGTNGDFLLSKEFEKMKDNEKKDILKKLAKENKYLTGDQVGYKFVISIFSVVCLFMYGVPLIGIAFANVFLQILAILLTYLLPVIALISLLPRFSDGLVNSIINVAKILAAKGLLTFVVLFFTLINLTVDLLIPPSSITTVLSNIILKGLIYYFMWVFREPLLRMLTRAVMNRKDSATVNMRMKQFDRHMNNFGEPEFLPNGGNGNNGGGESFENEAYHDEYEDPEIPAYTEDEKDNPDELKESSTEQEDVDQLDKGEGEGEDQEIEVEEPKEAPVEDPELPSIEDIPIEEPEDASIEEPSEFPVEEPQEIPLDSPDDITIDDPSTIPIDPIDDPDVVRYDHPASDSANDPKNLTDIHVPVTPTIPNQVVDKGVEDQIDRQIQVYQHNHDNRTLQQQNDFSQHQTATINNQKVTKESTNHFSSRLKELRD